jgi:hypothetical protein
MTTEWAELTGFFTAATCTPVESFIYVEGAPVGSSFYIDDAELEPLP